MKPSPKLTRTFRHPLLLLVVILVIVLPLLLYAQPERRLHSVVFYNVENLFDIFDDEGINDNDFLPDAPRAWDAARYLHKLQGLAAVISEPGGRQLPVLIGLAEIENRQVVEDLAVTGRLNRGKYGVVHFDSPDRRGIDVALLYRKSKFDVLHEAPIRVKLPGRRSYSTRDILYVKGLLQRRDTLHLFVMHWPSRVGGTDRSNPDRAEVARVLKSTTDSILLQQPGAKIIAMGDLNDTPGDVSVSGILEALHPDVENHSGLYNLLYPLHEAGKGTYFYRGEWSVLDHLLVSPSLLRSDGLHVAGGQGHIYKADWISNITRNGDTIPARTYNGTNYLGGISDHYPVFLKLRR